MLDKRLKLKGGKKITSIVMKRNSKSYHLKNHRKGIESQFPLWVTPWTSSREMESMKGNGKI